MRMQCWGDAAEREHSSADQTLGRNLHKLFLTYWAPVVEKLVEWASKSQPYDGFMNGKCEQSLRECLEWKREPDGITIRERLCARRFKARGTGKRPPFWMKPEESGGKSIYIQWFDMEIGGNFRKLSRRTKLRDQRRDDRYNGQAQHHCVKSADGEGIKSLGKQLIRLTRGWQSTSSRALGNFLEELFHWLLKGNKRRQLCLDWRRLTERRSSKKYSRWGNSFPLCYH